MTAADSAPEVNIVFSARTGVIENFIISYRLCETRPLFTIPVQKVSNTIESETLLLIVIIFLVSKWYQYDLPSPFS